MHVPQMQEAEEQDTCRICSAPAEPDQPLFYPCKCSGTIRYIHQDCLTTWLAHSKKKTCDVCKYPYSFTKVYAPDMPTRLPPVLLIRRLAQQSLFMLLFGIRAVAVGIIWLAILPWITVWTWRMYFSVGDSAAWWISDRPRPPSTSPSLPDYLPPTPATEASLPSSTSLLVQITSHPVWIALSADIFTGQIIASLVVLTFVAVFLLREWISQNARPGVFEDEDVPQDERQRPQQEAEPQPPPLPGVPPAPPRMPLVDRLAEARREVEAARARGAIIGHPIGDRPIQNGRRAIRHNAVEREPSTSQRDRENPTDSDDVSDSDLRAQARRRLHYASRTERANIVGDVEDFEGWRKRSFSHRLHSTRLSRFDQREAAVPQGSSGEGDLRVAEGQFGFTFRASARLPRRSLSEPQTKRYLSGVPLQLGEASSSEPSPFPLVELEPPLEPVPFAFPKPDEQIPHDSHVNLPATSSLSASPVSLPYYPSMASPYLPTTGLNPLIASPVPSQAILRRPPLPITLPLLDDIISTSSTPGLLPSSTSMRTYARTPSDSPGLATYKAPEELEAGPSSLSGYFDSHDRSIESDQSKYFRERSPDEDGAENLGTGGESYHADNSEDETEDEDRDDKSHERVIDGDDEDEDDEDILDGVDWEPEMEPDENDVLDARAGEFGPGQPQQAAGEAAPQPEANDELDGNVEDDMEGAMEALGMRGPIYGVVQNAALMVLLLDTALGLGIWIPFTIGKSAALLSLDPYRFLQLLHVPIRTMRIVTDPVVDSVVFLIVQFIVPSLVNAARLVINVFLSVGEFFLAKFYGQDGMKKSFQSLSEMYDRFGGLLKSRKDALLAWSFSIDNSSPSEFSVVSSGFSRIVMPLLGTFKPQYNALAENLTDSTIRLQAMWKRMALGQGANERAFAVALGYVVVGLLISLYLNILTVGNVRSAGRAVRSAVRQQLLVMKVAAFIFIELVVFPLGCGIVLDLCTVWLFPEANLLSRVVYFLQAPLTAMFYHWVAGTMFMYSFAVLLAGCRSIMRPGAMWFIKDPQDQNSHPIRDILERPTLTQLRKILISGVMYSFVVACVVGSVAGLLVLGSKSIMPFRWKNREPLSHVPIDLLFLHQVLPYTMYYFRPKRVLRKVSMVVWRHLAHRLRLTSYFFGERQPSEERSSTRWFRSLGRQVEDDPASVPDGIFRRVPNTDHVALPRDMRATAVVHENGEPVDDEAKRLMATQNLEAEKAKRVIKDDYIIVYIPPHFRYRVMYFIFQLWVIGAVSVGLFVGFPIQLGRYFFKLFIAEEIHDGYSFTVGFYLFWGCYNIGKSIDRLDKRRQRRNEVGPRSDLSLYVVKRALLWIPNISYMVLFLGIVIPILISFVVDLYIILPIRLALDPLMTPRVRIVDMWALGIVYVNIILHVYRLQPESRIMTGVQNVMNNGWTHPDPVVATKEVIGPAIIGLSGMIVLPAAAFLMVQQYLPYFSVNNSKFLFMHVYPGIFAFAGLVRTFVIVFRFWSTWSQAIRDKEFLVEMRLRNLEPEKEDQSPDIISAKDTETEYSSD